MSLSTASAVQASRRKGTCKSNQLSWCLTGAGKNKPILLNLQIVRLHSGPANHHSVSVMSGRWLPKLPTAAVLLVWSMQLFSRLLFKVWLTEGLRSLWAAQRIPLPPLWTSPIYFLSQFPEAERGSWAASIGLMSLWFLPSLDARGLEST